MCILAPVSEISSRQISQTNISRFVEFPAGIDPIFAERTSQPFRWTYHDHPIAEPILIGKASPIVLGLLILFATLASSIALTPEHVVDQTIRSVFPSASHRSKRNCESSP